MSTSALPFLVGPGRVKKNLCHEVEANFPMFDSQNSFDSLSTNDVQLNYVFKSPKFLTTCIFGVGFILIGNTAANSVQFGQNVQIAAGRVPSVGGICGIGIGATAVACCLHTMSRRWGIRMNNIFGFSKFLILIFLIIVGFSAAAKGPIAEDGTLLHSPSNLDPSRAFSNEHRSSRPFRYAEAFLFVLFPFGGFHQGNYVSIWEIMASAWTDTESLDRF